MEEHDQKNQEEEQELESLEQRKLMIQKECDRSVKTKKIDFTSCSLDDLDALQIALYLTESSHQIIALHLGTNNITDEGIAAISSTLHTHEELQELYLANNQFEEVGISSLISSLQFLPNLQVLSLGGCNIADNEVTKLAYTFSTMTKCNLKQLFLNNNKISNIGLFSLSIILSNNKVPLETLHLGENDFTYEGFKLLCEAIEQNKTLQTLFLNDNQFDELSIYAVTKAVFHNETLINLNLGNCNINDTFLEVLVTGIRGNSNLEMLHLWGNHIEDKGMQLLIETIEKYNQTLTYISLHDNNIQDYEENVHLLDEMLKQNAQIQQEALKQFQKESNQKQSRNQQKTTTFIQLFNSQISFQILEAYSVAIFFATINFKLFKLICIKQINSHALNIQKTFTKTQIFKTKYTKNKIQVSILASDCLYCFSMV